jgi:hypothetical protein
MILASKEFWSKVLGILEPDIIRKIGVRRSKYLVNIHPLHYFDLEGEFMSGNKTEEAQFYAVKKNVIDQDDYSPDNLNKTNQMQNLSANKKTTKDDLKNEIDLRSTTEDNISQEEVLAFSDDSDDENFDDYLSNDIENKNDSTQSKSQKQKLLQSKQNVTQKTKVKEAQEAYRVKRIAEITSIIEQICELYSSSAEDLKHDELNPIFDDIISGFITKDIEDSINAIIAKDKNCAKILVNASIKHHNFCSILLNCLFITTKREMAGSIN